MFANSRMKMLASSFTLLGISTHCDAHEKTAMTAIKIYSNICFHEETGDLMGERILVLHLDKDFVVYQSVIGDRFSKPDFVTAHLMGESISFSIPSPSENSGTFNGKIKEDQIVGFFSGGQLDVFGKSSYMLGRTSLDKLPKCK